MADHGSQGRLWQTKAAVAKPAADKNRQKQIEIDKTDNNRRNRKQMIKTDEQIKTDKK